MITLFTLSERERERERESETVRDEETAMAKVYLNVLMQIHPPTHQYGNFKKTFE